MFIFNKQYLSKKVLRQLNFNNYTYKNIDITGLYQFNTFDGNLKIDDEHFKMNFSALADLSSSLNKFDLKSEIKYLNLKETKLYKRDTIAILKGNVKIDLEGNTFDDMAGKLIFNNISYTNQFDQFDFKQFNLSSSIKDNLKRIEIASEDIANGYLSGNFYFSELEQHYKFFQALPPVKVSIVTNSESSFQTFFLLLSYRFPLFK